MIKLTKDNGYVLLEQGLVTGWKKVSSIQELCEYNSHPEEEPAHPVWTGGHVSEALIGEALALIKHYPYEVVLALYYNPDTRDWKAFIPKQSGSRAAVAYDGISEEIPKGYYFQGTIHSHPRMGAFWSGTDMRDQRDKSGLHLVVGTDAEGNMTSHVASLFLFGECYDTDGFDMPTSIPEQPREDWIKLIDTQELKRKVAPVTYTFTGSTRFPGLTESGVWSSRYSESRWLDYINEEHKQEENASKVSEYIEDVDVDENILDLCGSLQDAAYCTACSLYGQITAEEIMDKLGEANPLELAYQLEDMNSMSRLEEALMEIIDILYPEKGSTSILDKVLDSPAVTDKAIEEVDND